MSSFKPVTHVIFDCDGLLLDTEKLYTMVHQEVCKGYGKMYSWELQQKLMGRLRREMIEAIVETLDLPVTADIYMDEAVERYKALFPATQLMPDTEPAYDSIYSKIAEKHGKAFTWDLKVKFMGTVERDSCRIFVEDLNLPVSPEEVFQEQQARQPRALANCPLKPGAERLVRHLVAHGVPIAVATSSSVESMGYKTTNHKDFMSLFHHVVMGSSDPEVKRGKPHPDIFLVCASRFPDKPWPHQCLVVEDAPNGVAAARAAGMQVVMVPDCKLSEECKQGATLLLPSLEQFQPELFGLPPFEPQV